MIYFQLSRSFVEIEEKLYEVIRSYRESQIAKTEELRIFLEADKVFRREDRLFFVREISEAQIITDEELPEASTTES
jgi:hypothetical protein